MLDVALRSSHAAGARALLREPCARDELLPRDAGPTAVTELVAALLVERPAPWLGRADVWQLSLGDRDRLVAALHAQCFGDAIESVVACTACTKRFEINFSLAALLESIEPPPSSPRARLAGEDGTYGLPDGRRFRLPTTGDERAVTGWPVQEAAGELARRCLVDGIADSALEEAMAAVSPVIDLDVPATCANCGHEQNVHFDMVSFFVATLARERPILLGEVHRLATTYHWSREEIMGLPRSLRRAHVALIEADRGTLQAAS
jgi:hypothetical protein